MLLLNLVVFCYCTIAFYVAITNYVTDGNDRYLIQSQNHIYNSKLSAAITARAIQYSASSKKDLLATLTTACNVVGTELAQINASLPNVTYYDTMYASNNQCNSQINSLNLTFIELKSNSTITTLGNGYCKLISDIDEDPEVLFFYRKLTINDFDFYYYVFPFSHPVSSNGTMFAISQCVPSIFDGPIVRQGYKSGFIAGGANVSYIDIGLENVNITMTSGFQTIQFSNFQIWSRGI